MALRVRGSGLLWIVGWWLIYHEPAGHPRVSRAESDGLFDFPGNQTAGGWDGSHYHVAGRQQKR
jgi:hypothetical protein